MNNISHKLTFLFLNIIAIVFLSSCMHSPSTLKNSANNDGVKILRDEYGTPHIYADNTYDLFYGYGYSVAQDRLFQMEMAKRSTQGRVAEVLGRDYLAFDIQARQLYSPASIKQQLARLSAENRDIFLGYAAGINAWIKKINQQSNTLMPKQFNDFAFTPSQWDAFDVVMIFVGTMANRFGDFNTELDNAQIRHDLIARFGDKKGQAIFDDLNPRFTHHTSTTISENDWQPPMPVASITKTYKTEHGQFLDTVLTQGVSSDPISGFSNCYVLGKEKSQDANAILVNGPQFGWFDPAYTYSVGLHGAGFDLVGNTPFAYPVVLFGHNADIGWGSTWGAGDIVDLYSLTLDENNPKRYLYQGSYRQFDQRIESIAVKGQQPHQQVIYRSVHGPVVVYDKKNGIAYSKKRTWDGNELNSLLAWITQTKASDYQTWLTQAKQLSLNINWYYADRGGNIGYAYTGHYPVRQADHDNRIPANGDGSMDWLGIQDFAYNPHAYNPDANYLANWNNKPAHGVLNPDMYWYSWSNADRVDFLQERLSSQEKFTPQQAWQLLEASSYGDVAAKFLLPLIDKAVKQSAKPELNALNLWLQAWDSQATDHDNDGYYDQAQYLFMQMFAKNLIRQVLNDELGENFHFFQGTGYPSKNKPTNSGINISTGLKTTYQALIGKTQADLLNGQAPEKIIEQVLLASYQQLSVQYGNDFKQWQLALYPRKFKQRNFMGIPQNNQTLAFSTPLEQNRGTENNITVFYQNRIEGYEAVPPGQSGFIAPDGTPSPHIDDQLELYQSFGKKRMWFYLEDVKRQAKSTTILQPTR